MTRYVLAAILAPLVPVAIVAILASRDANFGGNVGGAAMWSYLGALTLGVPTFLFCRNRQWLRWWQLGVAGLVVGGLAPLLQLSLFLVYAVLGGATVVDVVRPLLPVVLVGALIGASIAVAFWAVARPPTNAP